MGVKEPMKWLYVLLAVAALAILAGIYRENEGNLRKTESQESQETLQAILARGIRVKIRGTVKACRDPHDDMFLECAALAKADLLVAGDKDLLTLGAYKGTRIVTPTEYLRAK